MNSFSLFWKEMLTQIFHKCKPAIMVSYRTWCFIFVGYCHLVSETVEDNMFLGQHAKVLSSQDFLQTVFWTTVTVCQLKDEGLWQNKNNQRSKSYELQDILKFYMCLCLNLGNAFQLICLFQRPLFPEVRDIMLQIPNCQQQSLDVCIVLLPLHLLGGGHKDLLLAICLSCCTVNKHLLSFVINIKSFTI